MVKAVLGLLVLVVACGSSSTSPPDAGVTPPPDAGVEAEPPARPAPDGGLPDGDQPDGDQPDGGPTVPGILTVDWRLQYVRSNADLTCEDAGTVRVRLRLSPSGGGRSVDLSFLCNEMSLRTPVPPGRYHVVLTLHGAGDLALSRAEGDFESRPGQTSELGQVTFEIQSFQLAWTLNQRGQATTCQAIGATTVELGVRVAAGPVGEYDFSCIDGQGSTPAILPGVYQVVVRLLGAGRAVLWQTAMPMEVIVSDDQLAVLPPVVFDL
jgi:hypothetical protein